MSLAKKREEVSLLLAFGEVQEPLRAGAASPFLQQGSEEPCAPLRRGKVWSKKGQVAINYLSIFSRLSDQELCWGLA